MRSTIFRATLGATPSGSLNGNLSNVGAYTVILDHQTIRMGAYGWTDDANTSYNLIVWGRANSLAVGSTPTWSIRLYDVTNAQAIIGPLLFPNAAGSFRRELASDGPLSTLPSGDALWRFEYIDGGNGCEIYSARFEVRRRV